MPKGTTCYPVHLISLVIKVHDGCAEPKGPFFDLGKQAPLSTVELYNTTISDTYKVAGAMYTELDFGIEKVVNALKKKGMWQDTLLIFVSDNGGPLDHCTVSVGGMSRRHYYRDAGSKSRLTSQI